MEGQKQREYFRLAYPDSYRPSLMMAIDNYEIEDVSEYGIKLKVEEDSGFMVDDDFMAIIAFPDGREFDLSGHVVRLDQSYAGLHLDTPLPLSIIRSETLYVISNYPSLELS